MHFDQSRFDGDGIKYFFLTQTRDFSMQLGDANAIHSRQTGKKHVKLKIYKFAAL